MTQSRYSVGKFIRSMHEYLRSVYCADVSYQSVRSDVWSSDGLEALESLHRVVFSHHVVGRSFPTRDRVLPHLDTVVYCKDSLVIGPGLSESI
jgi:hypothetical protein